MEYWQGYMNWALEENWKCEICGGDELTWGLVHAQCRCNMCQTQYRMRDNNDIVVETPICQLKPEFHKRIKDAWVKFHLPMNEMPEEVFNLEKTI